MSKRYQIEHEMEDVEIIFQEWAIYKLIQEPINPLESITQRYAEFVGSSGKSPGAKVPVRLLDAMGHSVPLIESLMNIWPSPMGKAVVAYYCSPSDWNKGKRQKMWSDETSGNRHQYKVYLESARWCVWARVNPRGLM